MGLERAGKEGIEIIIMAEQSNEHTWHLSALTVFHPLLIASFINCTFHTSWKTLKRTSSKNISYEWASLRTATHHFPVCKARWGLNGAETLRGSDSLPHLSEAGQACAWVWRNREGPVALSCSPASGLVPILPRLTSLKSRQFSGTGTCFKLILYSNYGKDLIINSKVIEAT